MFELGKILAAALLPPGLFILAFVVAAILSLRKKGRAVFVLCSCSAVLLYALSIGPVSGLLARPLEDRYPPLASASAARAVVVLGGGHIDGSPVEGGEAELGPASAARTSYGARLALASGLNLLYSGGSPLEGKGAQPESEVALRFLKRLGFPEERIMLEGASRDTFENATLTAELDAVGRGKKGALALVTSAFHMPRSVLAFKKAGMEVLPAPTDYRVDRSRLIAADFLPSTGSLELSFIALHEYIGLAYYSLR